jgi:hypothetical protein
MEYLEIEFNKLLLDLMKDAAGKIHTALKPLYATIDPSLPTFLQIDDLEGAACDEEQSRDDSLLAWAKSRLRAVLSESGNEAKSMLKEQSRSRAERNGRRRFFETSVLP